MSKPEEETKEAPAKPAKQAKQAKQPKSPKAGSPKANKKPAALESLPDDLSEELAVWAQCDLRVARIVDCKAHHDSDKLYVEQIDLGEGRLRTIGSGLQKHVPLPDMTKGLCVVFANLKPRKLADLMSEGMVMCADDQDNNGGVQIMRPPEGSEVGERIQLEGHPIGGAPLTNDWQKELNQKKKLERKLIPLLMTNDNCEGEYNGIKMITKAGPIKCESLKKVNIKWDLIIILIKERGRSKKFTGEKV